MGEILDQLISFQVLKRGDKVKQDKDVNIVLTKNGAVEIRNTLLGRVVKKCDTCPGLEEISEGFEFALPKIPITLLYEVIDFFKQVYDKYKTEAMAHIYLDKTTKRYFVHIPEQEVSSAALDYKRNKNLERANILVMDMHSHHTMNDFFSGTDDGDEKGDRLFAVVGNIQNNGSISIRMGAGKNKIELAVDDVFDTPKSNPDWMNVVKEKKYTYTAGNGKQVGFWNKWNKNESMGTVKREPIAAAGYEDYGFGYVAFGFEDDAQYERYLELSSWPSEIVFENYFYNQNIHAQRRIISEIAELIRGGKI